jgi:hypothetical protein
LVKGEVNIHHANVLRYRRNGHSAIAMYVDDTDLAVKILDDGGYHVITEGDLLADDHYL